MSLELISREDEQILNMRQGVRYRGMNNNGNREKI